MDPIRPRRPSPAREPLPARPQPDGVQPTADRGCLRLLAAPGWFARSADDVPDPAAISPCPSPAFSAGSFSDLLRPFDPSLLDTSLLDSMPAVGTPHTAAAPAEWMRRNRVCVQPMTRHPPCVSLSLPRGSRAPSRPRDGVRRNPPTLRRPRRWIYARSATVSSSKRRSNRMCVRQWRSTTRHWWAMGLHTHIVALSQHPAALGTVAVTYQHIITALPEATHEDIVGVGKQWSGARALEALLTDAGS